jgi:hypothetical protein
MSPGENIRAADLVNLPHRFRVFQAPASVRFPAPSRFSPSGPERRHAFWTIPTLNIAFVDLAEGIKQKIESYFLLLKPDPVNVMICQHNINEGAHKTYFEQVPRGANRSGMKAQVSPVPIKIDTSD